MTKNGDEIEETINGLIRTKSFISNIVTDIDSEKYHDDIDDLFRTIHSFKAHVSYMDFDEISSVLEKSEDIMSFLRSNKCVIGNEITHWFYIMQEQLKVWSDELSLILDNIDSTDVDELSFYSEELDESPAVKVIGYNNKNKIISSHRIIILLNDKNMANHLEKKLYSTFKLISTSDSIKEVSKIIKTSIEPRIIIYDIKLKDGNISDLINNQLMVNTNLIICSSINKDRIDKIKTILRTDNVFNNSRKTLEDIKNIAVSMVSPDDDSMIKIPFDSTKLPISKLTKSLKPLPEILTQVSDMCFDDDSRFQDLSNLIEQDVTITGKILKHINSPHYGLRNTITTINQAVVMLGKKKTYAAAVNGLTDELIPDVDISMYGITTTEVIKINYIRSKLLEEWCKELGIPSKTIETINTISLVTVLGTYLTAKALDFNLQFSKFKQSKETDELFKVEKKLLDYSSFDVSAKLFSKWNFPEIFIWTAKEMPLYKFETKKVSTVKQFAFIISILYKIIRMDGIFKIDDETLNILSNCGYEQSTLENAWKKIFGDTNYVYFKDVEI